MFVLSTIISLRSQLSLHLSVAVVLMMKQKLISFYNVLSMLPSDLICSLLPLVLFLVNGLDILINKKLNFYRLFGSTETANSENIEIFSHVQHFIRELNRFRFLFLVIITK